MKTKSLYSTACVCKPFKKLGAYFFDLLTSFIIGLLLFAIFEGIMNATPLVKDKKTEINSITYSMHDLVISSGLGKDNSNDVLISQNQYVLNYIKGATLKSLNRNSVENISNETYKDVIEIDDSNDGVFNYYTKFKVNNIDDYGINARENSGLVYYKNQLNNNNSITSYFEDEDYPYLTIETAKNIDEYLRNNSYAIGKEMYDKLDASYRTLLENGIYDIQHNYRPYLNLNEIYNDKTSSLYSIKNIEIVIVYFLSLFIVYLLFPIIFHNGQTLSFKIFKFVVVSKDDYEPTWVNYLMRYLIICLESLIIIPLISLVFYSADAIGWISQTLFLNFSFLSLGLYSLLILLMSFVLTFVLRNTRQTISEYLSMEIVKDITMYESKGINNGRKENDKSKI